MAQLSIASFERIYRAIENGKSQFQQMAFGRIANAMAPFVKYMASTGIGTDACLRHGCLPLLVHYFSPVPDIADLAKREVWNRKSQMIGIDFRPARQVELLDALGERFGNECNWSPHPSGAPGQFYTENNSFSYGCAASTHSMVRYFHPHTFIEIGSGYSSRVIGGALRLNAEDGFGSKYIMIDPYPAADLRSNVPYVTQVMEDRVELQDLELFTKLSKNDVLFIDSGHTVRIGGDVNFEILEILPRLSPGVIVHFHDIPMPYEYPRTYATNPRFRMFWTESYLLQAFLCFNKEFEILLAMNYLMSEKLDVFRRAFPHYDPSVHVSNSPSFWIRRKPVDS